jgi:hypothetical protein
VTPVYLFQQGAVGLTTGLGRLKGFAQAIQQGLWQYIGSGNLRSSRTYVIQLRPPPNQMRQIHLGAEHHPDKCFEREANFGHQLLHGHWY